MNKNPKERSNLKSTYDFSTISLLPIPDLLRLLDKAKCKSKSYDFDKSIIIKEFYLKMRPEKQDFFYSTHPLFLQNIRRGNSIIEYLSSESSKSERFLCRKGLMKFFDLHLSFLSTSSNFSSSNFLHKDDLLIKDLIFSEIEVSFKEKKQVIVYKSEKANGTNAQIAYIAKIDAWLIASKNNSVVVRNEADIEGYEESEFFFAKLLAKEWLKLLKEFTKENLEELKKELFEKTLIAEFIGGDKKTARLLNYSKKEFKFITLVEINSEKTCVVPEKALDFFKKFQLNSVKFEVLCEANTMEFLCKELKQVHNSISSSTISQEGEGAVLYFVIRDPVKKCQDFVASLCKVKTLEYRFFRKIREKLKKIQDKDKFPKNLLKNFKREAELLCEACEGTVDVEFYVNVAKEFFGQISKDYTKKNFKTCVNNFAVCIEKVVFNVRNKVKRSIFEENEAVIVITPPNYLGEKLEKEMGVVMKVERIEKKIDKNLVLQGKKGRILVLLEKLDENFEEIMEFFDRINWFIIGFEETAFQRITEQFPAITMKALESLKEEVYSQAKKLNESNVFYMKDVLSDQIEGKKNLIELIEKGYEIKAEKNEENGKNDENEKNEQNEQNAKNEENEKKEENEKNDENEKNNENRVFSVFSKNFWSKKALFFTQFLPIKYTRN